MAISVFRVRPVLLIVCTYCSRCRSFAEEETTDGTGHRMPSAGHLAISVLRVSAVLLIVC
jgi:hypothetical protein